MKVILLQDVAKIGRRFQVVSVPDGYAMNKLIPKRLAEPASPENIKRIEARAQVQAASEAGTLSAFADACAALKEKTIMVSVDANAEGKMFQALKAQIIVEAVKAEVGVDINSAWVQMPVAIKTTGEHVVLLTHGDAQGEFTINVASK